MRWARYLLSLPPSRPCPSWPGSPYSLTQLAWTKRAYPQAWALPSGRCLVRRHLEALRCVQMCAQNDGGQGPGGACAGAGDDASVVVGGKSALLVEGAAGSCNSEDYCWIRQLPFCAAFRAASPLVAQTLSESGTFLGLEPKGL